MKISFGGWVFNTTRAPDSPSRWNSSAGFHNFSNTTKDTMAASELPMSTKSGPSRLDIKNWKLAKAAPHSKDAGSTPFSALNPPITQTR